MKRLENTPVFIISTVVLVLITAIFYVASASFIGWDTVFRRGDGTYRYWKNIQPFLSPIEKSAGEGLFWETSFWAWPFNDQALINPYIYLLLGAIILITIFIVFQARSKRKTPEETQVEHMKKVRQSYWTITFGILGITLGFSVFLYLLFTFLRMISAVNLDGTTTTSRSKL